MPLSFPDGQSSFSPVVPFRSPVVSSSRLGQRRLRSRSAQRTKRIHNATKVVRMAGL